MFTLGFLIVHIVVLIKNNTHLKFSIKYSSNLKFYWSCLLIMIVVLGRIIQLNVCQRINVKLSRGNIIELNSKLHCYLAKNCSLDHFHQIIWLHLLFKLKGIFCIILKKGSVKIMIIKKSVPIDISMNLHQNKHQTIMNQKKLKNSYQLSINLKKLKNRDKSNCKYKKQLRNLITNLNMDLNI